MSVHRHGAGARKARCCNARRNLVIAVVAAWVTGLAGGSASWSQPPLPKPSATLLRSLQRFERDLQALDMAVPGDPQAMDPSAAAPDREILKLLQAPWCAR